MLHPPYTAPPHTASMSIQDRAWNTIHTSALNQARILLRPVRTRPSAHGAVRYQCPVNGSFVVVTDDRTLATLVRPRARLRCPSCGEVHLLLRERADVDAALATVDPGRAVLRPPGATLKM